MGVFERGEDTERLHFHGIFYIPDGEMVGKIFEREDYSTAQHKIQKTQGNTFFDRRFGRSDFEEINDNSLRYGDTNNYMLKYLEKSGERIVYSRGIPTQVYCVVRENEIAGMFLDYVEKALFFDDFLDWEMDIMHFKPYQMVFEDYLKCRIC